LPIATIAQKLVLLVEPSLPLETMTSFGEHYKSSNPESQGDNDITSVRNDNGATVSLRRMGGNHERRDRPHCVRVPVGVNLVTGNVTSERAA